MKLTSTRDIGRWISDRRRRLRRVAAVLADRLGAPPRPGVRDGLQVLVCTILSQNTTDLNALAAYRGLIAAFGSTGRDDERALPRRPDGQVDKVALRMSQVADALAPPDYGRVHAAGVARLARAIRVAGLQEAKARAIHNVLDWLVAGTGGYRLDQALRGLEAPEAVRQLSSIGGVGVKTAAVTLVEAFGADLCPVDTHVHRICARLDLVPESASPDATYRQLSRRLPPGIGYRLHHNLLTFGRSTCTARAPQCERCPLRGTCRHWRVVVRDEEGLPSAG